MSHAVGVIVVVAMVAFAVPAGADTTWSVVPADANGPDKKVVTAAQVRAALLRDADALIVHHGGVRL